jgi:hypothetical protein
VIGVSASEQAACEHEWHLSSTREELVYPKPTDERLSSILKVGRTTRHWDTWYCSKCETVEERLRKGEEHLIDADPAR